ncbi:MAG: carbohydrate-binding protein, partial [Bacteroidota bacterium]
MKKVEETDGPLSVVKKAGYQTLLNYWENGGNKPSTSFAKAALMELAEGFKMENCVFQKDVLDAMFRQVYSEESLAFSDNKIPGVLYATHYNLGRNGFAYFDGDVATYHVSTGNFTAWNSGWAYRNDAVDIEPCQDNIHTNGFNVGWINEGEWMEYDIEVDSTAVYDVELRMATAGFEGAFHLEADGGRISGLKYVPS